MATEQATVSALSELVNYYAELQEQRNKIQLSMDIVKSSIINNFKLAGGITVFVSNEGTRARLENQLLTVRRLKQREIG